jgi:hypothetical protein
MWKVKIGLVDFLKTEINLMMREFKPRTDEWEDRQAFEGAYEEVLPILRPHVVKTLKRDERKMHGFRKVNSRIQRARAEQRKELFAKQEIHKRPVGLESKLKEFEACREDSPAAQRKQVKIIA